MSEVQSTKIPARVAAFAKTLPLAGWIAVSAGVVAMACMSCAFVGVGGYVLGARQEAARPRGIDVNSPEVKAAAQRTRAMNDAKEAALKKYDAARAANDVAGMNRALDEANAISADDWQPTK